MNGKPNISKRPSKTSIQFLQTILEITDASKSQNIDTQQKYEIYTETGPFHYN